MAEEADSVINRALEELVSVTEKSGNLRKDLKDLILKSVSNIRNTYSAVKICMNNQNEQIALPNARVEEMEKRLCALAATHKDEGQ